MTAGVDSGSAVTVVGTVVGVESARSSVRIEEHSSALSKTIQGSTAGYSRRAAVVLATTADEVHCAHVWVGWWAHSTATMLTNAATPSKGSSVALSSISTSKHVRMVSNFQPWAVSATGGAASSAVTLFLITVLHAVIAVWPAITIHKSPEAVPVAFSIVARAITFPILQPILGASGSTWFRARGAAASAIDEHLVTVSKSIGTGSLTVPVVGVAGVVVAGNITDAITNETVGAERCAVVAGGAVTTAVNSVFRTVPDSVCARMSTG